MNELRSWLLQLANETMISLLFGKLHERMTTNKGRELALERYTYMKDFFVRLRKEVEGEL